jgi:high-affinity iron transporter
VVLLFFVLLAAATPAVGATDTDAQSVVHLLDYVAVDYPGFVRDGKVLDAQEYKEQVEFARHAGELLQSLPRNAASTKLARDAATLRARIEAKAPGEEVSRLATALRWEVIAAYNIAVAPRRAPDLRAGAKRYASLCASCHGPPGRGDGPAARGMEPRPANFHDARRMDRRSVYGLYSTISLGVGGTPMPAFRQLSDDERWARAVYVSSLGADPAQVARGRTLWQKGEGRAAFADLRDVATASAAEVGERHGADARAVLAFLQSEPRAVSGGGEGPVQMTQRLLDESLAALRSGERGRAHELALAAYLEGYEPVEGTLDTVDRDLRVEIEAQMMAYRSLLRGGGTLEQAQAQRERVGALLDTAAEKLSSGELSPSAAAFSALVIILREGLEAILVLAAILAFVSRSGRPDARRYVHAGWMAAIVLGVATWALAATLIGISGANREVTEGATALIASAMLLYVGYWLHDKSHAKAWTSYIQTQTDSALGTGTLWSLSVLAFFAVYRELFEVILFWEALWAQAGPAGHAAVAGGAVGGIALLALATVAIFRFGVRLPLGLFFSACAILLLVMAVAFAGQGVAALQEAGVIPVHPVAFVRLPMLGVFPTAQTLAAQATVIAIMVAVFLWSRRGERQAQA